MIWNVVFANKSWKLEWIWMKLGRWGWGLRVSSEIALWVSDRAQKMGRRGIVFFCDVNDAAFLPLSLYQFPPNFPRTRVQVVARETSFHIPEKFPLRDRICQKTLFLGYPICAQPMGLGKCSVTPTLFPSPCVQMTKSKRSEWSSVFVVENFLSKNLHQYLIQATCARNLRKFVDCVWSS